MMLSKGTYVLVSVPFVFVLFCVFGTTVGQYEAKTLNGVRVTPAMLYNDCNQRVKRCFGDTEDCLAGRNCTMAASISENRTHFDILLLNGCADPKEKNHHYLAVGLTTLDSHRNQVCREPTFEDFKVFMLWDPIKCEKRNLYAYQMYWTSRSKSNWRQNCDYYESVHGKKTDGEFNLGNYFKNNIILSTSSDEKIDNAPAFAPHVDYKIVNKDVILYINRYAPTTEPVDVGISGRNNLKPGEAASQSTAEDSADSDDSGSVVLQTGSFVHIISVLIFFYTFTSIIV